MPNVLVPGVAERVPPVGLLLDDGSEILRTRRGDVFVRFKQGEHYETWRIESNVARAKIMRVLRGQQHRALTHAQVEDEIHDLSGRAHHEARIVSVFRRIGAVDGFVYIDLGDDDWHAIEVSPDGWRVIQESPVVFERLGGMLALPQPEHGGDISELCPFVNVGSDDDFMALVSFIVECFNPMGPYPLLVLNGPEGSAKSTLAKVVRALVDPNSSPVRGEPRDAWSLMISAESSRLLAYDNLSHVPQWLSDALSGLATGNGYSVRRNYGNREEEIFNAQVPIITTSITNLFTRGDLLSRSVILRLPPIVRRRAERVFWEEFNAVSGRLLGVILDGVAAALRNANRDFESPIRMADFAAWAAGASEAFGWNAEDALASLANRAEDNAGLAVDSAAMGRVLSEIAEAEFEGTNDELLRECERRVPAARRGVGWPSNARGMRNAVDRLEGSLQLGGYRILHRRAGGQRLVRLGRDVPAV